MSKGAGDFFAELERRGHEPLLTRMSGTIRFDIGHGRQTDHWLVTVKRGRIGVRHENGPADAIIGVSESLFGEIAGGRANTMAAFLRGAVSVEGNLELLLLFQRVLPQRRAAGALPARQEAVA